MYPYRAPYMIANGISIGQESYSWRVGDIIDFTGSTYPGITIPDGQYTIQICEAGTSICDSSNAPFTIFSSSSDNKPPVISGINTPTALSVGQVGTWIINASDPENSALSYYVTWGDEATASSLDYTGSSLLERFVQNTSFTHLYSASGTYTVTFRVKDSAGLSSKTSATINVTN